MILVTVGTTNFPFDRLFRAVDTTMCGLNTQERLVVQGNKNHYVFSYPHTTTIQVLAFNELIKLMKRSRVIITHGGPATIYQALFYGKHKPFTVPRLKKHKEHIDSHQKFFVDVMRKNNLVASDNPLEALENQLTAYIQKPIKNGYQLHNPSLHTLIDRLTAYTDSLV